MIITQSGKLRTIIPELTSHFEEDMIVLEKWKPQKPISAIYYDGDKERYYIKRFLVENESREEMFISDHEKSKLEVVSTDYLPRVEVVFSKVKGVQKESLDVNVEQFIAIKGIKALGNQLTADKVKQVNLLESYPFEEEEEIEEVLDVVLDDINPDLFNIETDGQVSIALDEVERGDKDL